MIKTKKELDFYIKADRIMRGLPLKPSLKEKLVSYFNGGGIIDFQRLMRKYSYYSNISNPNIIQKIKCNYYHYLYKKISLRLNFSIGPDVFGYGLLIPHYGTIVINSKARVGNFAVVHTCTNIAGKKIVGDALYLATGSQIVGDITIGDNVSVAANSLVNKDCDSNTLVGGVPSRVLRNNYPAWYIRDGKTFEERVYRVERLRKEMNIQ